MNAPLELLQPGAPAPGVASEARDVTSHTITFESQHGVQEPT